MNDQQRAAMQMALMDLKRDCPPQLRETVMRLDTALREALAQQQEHGCNQHPDAHHGFDRNASHSANRYVCECEGWQPDHVAGAGKVIGFDFSKQPKQFTRF